MDKQGFEQTNFDGRRQFDQIPANLTERFIGEIVPRESLDGTDNFELIVDKGDPGLQYTVTRVMVFFWGGRDLPPTPARFENLCRPVETLVS